MIYEDYHYDARKSRELVNMKILVSLDKLLMGFILFLSQQRTSK